MKCPSDMYRQHTDAERSSGILVSESAYIQLMHQIANENTPDDSIRDMINDIDDSSGCLIPRAILFTNAVSYRNQFQKNGGADKSC